MKGILFSLFVLSITLDAFTLEEILQSQKRDNKTKSIQALRDAQIAQNSLYASYEAPRLDGSLAHAKDPAKEGMEFSVGISQNINNPFGAKAKENLITNLSNATKQEAKHELHLRELDIASKYYAACSSKELELQSKSLYEQQQKRVAKLKSAYELGEISKKELLFNQLDLAKFHKNTNTYKKVYLEEFASLQKSVGDLLLDSVTCNDLQEPKREILVKSLDEHGELQRLEYQKNAANSLYELYDSPLQDIGYELVYESELETERYRVGLSIPLSVFTSKQELLREQELKNNSSYTYAKESLKNEISNTTSKLLLKLEVIYDEYTLLQNEILPLSKELLNLSEYAYKEGEGTLMEYLDSSRSYTENTLDMLESKKTYYYELFELYKITDMEYGEEICIK